MHSITSLIFQFKLRKEALSGLGGIFKRVMLRTDLSAQQKQRIDWVKNKVLHAYYQSSVDDRCVRLARVFLVTVTLSNCPFCCRVLVERIVNMFLVQFSLEPSERMRRLLQVYCTIDENAVRALQELLKTQMK